ncbi:hypothetical protein [Rhodospira trueperi]|uniref:Uncharacterized protein n=1 Tax=Rhodospira trueperi TaxID=69960 RepID=A0A1G7GWV7_9PROT|nr:hypothetical protein [Rhodospira trueperi]SDE92652.1 hypothetical protein SAMN05421720_11637 [Rhodospira trueperi]
MAQKRTFGRRRPDQSASAQSGEGPSPEDLREARSDTETFARTLYIDTRDHRSGFGAGAIMSGLAALVLLALAVPYLNSGVGPGSGASGQGSTVVAQDFDRMSPSELAELAPAAGESRGPLDWLLDALWQ